MFPFSKQNCLYSLVVSCGVVVVPVNVVPKVDPVGAFHKKKIKSTTKKVKCEP